MMKTRTVTVYGKLYLRDKDTYWFIRFEAIGDGFPPNTVGFLVTEADFNEKYLRAPFFLAVNAPWMIAYETPREVTVIDDDPEIFLEEEVDEQITEQDISEAEWERMLNDVDTHRFDTETENVE